MKNRINNVVTFKLSNKIIHQIRTNLNSWSITASVIVLVITSPILVILFHIFDAPGDTWQHLAQTVLPIYIINTILLVIGVGTLTFIIGVSTAWITSVYQFPGRRLFEWMLIMPLAIPAYIIAYTYSGMLDFTGPIHTFLRKLTGSNHFYFDIMTMEGAIFVISFVLFPYVYLITRTSFLQQSNTFFEAAGLMGKTKLQTFFQIALPMARPAIAGGLTLVFMELLNDYGAVKYYGIDTFTTGIFRAWFSIGDANSAIRLSAILLITVFFFIGIEYFQRGQARYDNSLNTFRPIRRHRLSGIKAVGAFSACLLPLMFGLIIPVSQLLYWASQTAIQVINWEFLQLITNSISLAVISSIFMVIAALLIIYAVRLNRNLYMKVISKLAIIGYSIPGAVIAIGVMLPFAWIDNHVDSWMRLNFNIPTGLLLTGTITALIFAYLVRFLALAINPIESGFDRTCRNLDEVSRSLGHTPFKTLLKIDIPLIKGTMLTAGILTFVDVLKELPLTLILRPFNFDTLATKAFELASDELIAESANAALIIIAAGIIPVFLINKLITSPNKAVNGGQNQNSP